MRLYCCVKPKTQTTLHNLHKTGVNLMQIHQPSRKADVRYNLSPPCEQCGKPMRLRTVVYSARRQDVTFVCAVCQWQATKSSEDLAG